MNELNQKRDAKFLNKLREKGDFGFFDYELAELFKWKLAAVRSTAGSLRKRSHVFVKETEKGWYICFVKDLENASKGKNKNSGTKTS